MNWQKKLLARTNNRPNARFRNGLADYITVHMTGNRTAGADAAAHASWHFTSAPYSWHSTVDDSEAWQQLDWGEQGWHAGDGSGAGNTSSIGLEICMNAGIDQEAAYANGAQVVRELLAMGHGRLGVVQHNHWTGKDCPELIRHEPGRWERFLKQVKEEDMAADPRVDALIAALGGQVAIDKWNGPAAAPTGNSLLAGYTLEQAKVHLLTDDVVVLEGLAKDNREDVKHVQSKLADHIANHAAGVSGPVADHTHTEGKVKRP